MRIRRQRGHEFRKSEKVRLGKRTKSTPDFHERPMRCWGVASVVPPWFTPSTRSVLPSLVPLPSSTLHPPAFHLPFVGLAHSFARSPARVRTSRQPRIEFTAWSCFEKTRRFGDKPRTQCRMSSLHSALKIFLHSSSISFFFPQTRYQEGDLREFR